MGFYEEYLSSYAWRLVREQVLVRDQYCYRLCEHTENLQVHHRTYARFGKEE